MPRKALPVSTQQILDAGRAGKRSRWRLHCRVYPEHVRLGIRKGRRQLYEQIDAARLEAAGNLIARNHKEGPSTRLGMDGGSRAVDSGFN